MAAKHFFSSSLLFASQRFDSRASVFAVIFMLNMVFSICAVDDDSFPILTGCRMKELRRNDELATEEERCVECATNRKNTSMSAGESGCMKSTGKRAGRKGKGCGMPIA